MTKKISTTMTVGFAFISIMIMTVLTAPIVSAVPFDVTLQGPDVTRDNRVAIRFYSTTNYGAATALRSEERWQRVGWWSLIDFDVDDYVDAGQPVQDVEISLYHYTTSNHQDGELAIELRPLTKEWTEMGSTGQTTDGTTEWDRGESWQADGYISGKDEDGNYLNFTDEVLGSFNVAGPDHANSTNQTWRVFSGAALDTYLNEVIAGTRVHYGFLMYNNVTQWGKDALYQYYSSDYTADPTLQPKMTFTVIPEPASMVLLGLGGLLLLKRRRV